MAIRFKESDARPMGRNTSGVKGIRLVRDDELVGMVVADPDATLLTACENGYGKRTLFGPNTPDEPGLGDAPPVDDEGGDEEPETPEVDSDEEEGGPSGARYRTQRRGGKGLHDIKTGGRNGRVIGITRVDDDDELLMMTARGKIQRIAAREISVIGRNTKGVRIMSLDEGDTLAGLVRVPKEDEHDEVPAAETDVAPEAESAPETPAADAPPADE
jgi:DNA gyrase subunit A